jgi:hypothetical protein
MLRHVAVFTWKPGTTERSLEAMRAGLAGLPGQIPEIRAYTFGPDAGLAEGNDAFAVVADFDDEEGWRRYATHPAHLEVIEELVRPLAATRHAVQLRCEEPS